MTKAMYGIKELFLVNGLRGRVHNDDRSMAGDSQKQRLEITSSSTANIN